MSDINIRALVADSLLEMEKSGVFLSVIESAVLGKYEYIDAKDKAFYKRLMDGTTEERIRIDYILGLFSSTKINKLKPYIRAVLRMSIYQIMCMDTVPDSAACNEAVKLIKKSGQAGLSGFVNGVLRNISRNKDNIKYPDKTKDWIRYASIVYSCPEWIVRRLTKEYGQSEVEGILEASIMDKPVSVRLRVEGTALKALESKWREAGITVETNPHIEYARLLSGTGAIPSMAGFDSGEFVVQDTGSMMVAHMAGIKAGDVIMDVCAAPGGKSMHAADILCKLEEKDNTNKPGIVYSYDVSPDKCIRIEENIARLNLTNIKVDAHDATILIDDMVESADVVIVDAPCSGLGVIGHKSDIKYRVQEEDIESLSKIQRSILDTAVKYVKPGGRLVYSTCTISRMENDEQVKYLKERYSYELVDTSNVPNPYQLIPGKDKSDGFYVAVLEKKA